MTAKHIVGAGVATQSSPELQREARLNQVVNYSEFLNELAAQRHTVLRKYASYPDHCKQVLDPLDALIRDVLRHIERNDLVVADPNTKTIPVKSAPTDQLVDLLTQQNNNLIDSIEREVIGDDEPELTGYDDEYLNRSIGERNQLREEQRTKLKEIKDE